MLAAVKLLFVLAIVAWFSYVMAGVLAVPHPKHGAPHPAPWSCAQLRKDVAPVDGGGQVAPVCGYSPYPVTPGADGDGD